MDSDSQTGIIVILILVLAALALLGGCAQAPEEKAIPGDGLSSHSAAEIAARLEEADALYGEPQTPERMIRSLEVSLDSVTPADEGGALWRAARACAWLAQRHPDESARLEYAQKGVAAGEGALSMSPAGPEPYFYQAINLGLLSQLGGGGFFRISRMQELATQVVSIDEKFEYAGGHRFLGKLCYETSGIPFAAAGTVGDAFRHLRRACQLFPNYGLNQLALAEVLIKEDKLEEARTRLNLVLKSPPPPGEAADHATWLAQARQLHDEIKNQ